MTEPTTNPASPEDAAPTVPHEPAPSPQRRWKRRLLWTLAILLVVGTILRVVLAFTLPSLLDSAAAHYGLECEYERLDLSLLAGDLELWHLTLRPKTDVEDGATPGVENSPETEVPSYVDTEYLRADLDVLQLLRGRLSVRRLEVDGMDIILDRREDGSLALLEHFAAHGASPEPVAPVEEEPASAAAEIDLRSPISISALRLQHARVLWRDASVTPPFEDRFEANVRLSSLGSEERSTRFALSLASTTSSAVLDVLQIEGEGNSTESALDAKFRLAVRGLHLARAEPYLEGLGLKANAETLSVTANAEIRALAPERPAPTAEAPGDGSPETSGNAKDEGPPPPPVLSATATLKDLVVLVDEEPALGLARVHLEAPSISALEIHLAQVVCEQGSVLLERHQNGSLELAGLVLPTSTDDDATATATGNTAPSTNASTAAEEEEEEEEGEFSSPNFVFRLDELRLSQLNTRLDDAAVAPPATLEVELDEVTVRDIVFGTKGVSETKGEVAPVTIQGQLSLPGIIEKLELEGEAVIRKTELTLESKLDASGIVLTALAPYLDAAGAEAALEAGGISAKLSGQLRLGANGSPHLLSVRLHDVVFKDRAELFGLRELALRNLALPTAGDPTVRLEALEIRGLRGVARRDAEGVLEVVGLRLGLPRKFAAAPDAFPTNLTAEALPATGAVREIGLASTAASPSTPTPPLAFPDISIGTVLVEETEFLFEDGYVEPPSSFRIEDAGVELRDLALGKASSGQDGTLRLWLLAPGLIESATAEGKIATTSSSAALDLNVNASGVTAERVGPYLKATGLEPALGNGSLSLHMSGQAGVNGDHLNASVAVENIVYKDGENELFGLGALRVDDIVLSPDGLEVGKIDVDRPRVSALRGSDGSFSAFGITVPAHAPEETTSEGAPSTSQTATNDVTDTRTDSMPATNAAPFDLVLGALRVAGARFRLEDEMAGSGAQLEASVDIDVGRVALTEMGRATPVTIKVRVPETLEELRLTGTIVASQQKQNATFQLEARGIRSGQLGPYLPAGLRVTLEDGYLSAELGANATLGENGDLQAAVRVENFAFREGGAAGEQLLSFAALRAQLGRLAADGSSIEVAEVALEALETEVRMANGTTRLLGLLIEAPPGEAVAQVGEPPVETPPEAATIDPESPAARTATPVTRVASVGPPPRFLLEKLALHIARCDVYLAADDPNARPLSLSDVRLVNTAPWSLLGEAAETQHPVGLRFTGQALPVLNAFRVDIELEPFAVDPRIDVQVELTGLQGTGLTAVLPDLTSVLDGTGLQDGRAGASFEATLRQKRRQPWELDFAKPFGAEVTLREVTFQATPDGPVLAGFDELRTEVASVKAATGDVHVRAVELTQIHGSVRRTAAGLEVLGLLIKNPEEETVTAPDVEEDDAVANAAPEATAPENVDEPSATPAPPAAAPSGEVRVDRILISGIDFTFDDQAVEPPTIIPLNSLELEVADLTTRALYENRPLRFNLLIGAGKVPLPKVLKKSALAGGIGDVASVLTGQGTPEEEFEEREVLQEMSASGRLSLFPRFQGWSKLGVSALELAALSGEAAAAGVTLDQGVLDCAVQVRFAADGAMGTRAKFRFTDLSLAEPPDGPIFRYLHLPAPLDTVLFVLRDENGGIHVPVNFELGADGISPLAVSRTAATTLGTLIARAIASSPLRAAGTVTELVPGLTAIPGFGGDDEALKDQTFAIQFAPADVGLDRSAREQLETILSQLRDNEDLVVTLRHQFGQSDIPLIEQRANPDERECVALVNALRDQRRRLTRERDGVAARTRAAFGARLERQATAGQVRLRSVETQLGQTEEALDAVLELLRPGAERQSSRRTRQAAAVVGQLRLRALRDYVLRAEWERPLERLRLVRARFEEASLEGGGVVEAVLSVREDL